MKKIYLLLISIFSFFCINVVYADEYIGQYPDKMFTTSGSVQLTTPFTDWWGYSGRGATGLFVSEGDNVFIEFSPSLELCKGDNITLKGTIVSATNLSYNAIKNFFSIQTNLGSVDGNTYSNCTYTLSNGGFTADFTCYVNTGILNTLPQWYIALVGFSTPDYSGCPNCGFGITNVNYSCGVNSTIAGVGEDIINNQNQNTQDIINNQNNNSSNIINNQNQNQQQTNDRLDDIISADISDADKELPNDDAYNNYQSSEDTLMDSVNQADTSILDIAIDTNSSNFVWSNLTKFVKSHSLVFGTFIAILSIGIIKLALGR